MSHETWTNFVKTTTPLTPSKVIAAALDNFEYDGDRNGSPSLGYTTVTEPMTEVAASYAVDGENYQVTSDRSYVIPVVADKDAVVKTTKLKLSVDAEELEKIRTAVANKNFYLPHFSLFEKARAVVGRNIIGYNVVALPKARKAVATATEGKSVTKYKIVNGAPSYSFNKSDIVVGFDSQAEARAAAVTLLNSPEGQKFSTLEVEAYIVRDGGGAALVSITRPSADESEVTIQVKTSNVRPGAKSLQGYLVGFDYHV